MEGFTVALALVDARPVLSFGISMGIIAGRVDSVAFMIGAALSVLAVVFLASPGPGRGGGSSLRFAPAGGVPRAAARGGHVWRRVP